MTQLNVVHNLVHIQKIRAASLTPGTCGKWLWLLPSGPDQVHHPQCGETRRGANSNSIPLCCGLCAIRSNSLAPNMDVALRPAARAPCCLMVRQLVLALHRFPQPLASASRPLRVCPRQRPVTKQPVPCKPPGKNWMSCNAVTASPDKSCRLLHCSPVIPNRPMQISTRQWQAISAAAPPIIVSVRRFTTPRGRWLEGAES
jgi:hypothetical protein